MPPAIIDLKSSEDSRDDVHRLVQALVEGRLVAFPTETVYEIAASALDGAAVANLLDAKQGDRTQQFSLAIRSVNDALDYIPDLCPLAHRLARRCWPGPLTLRLDASHPESVIGRLPPTVQELVVQQGRVGLRVPAHEMILSTMSLLAGPLVLAAANLPGEEPATDANTVAESFAQHVSIVVDGGPSKFGKPSSLVEISGSESTLVREGVLDQKTLNQLSQFCVLLVCTGNTCRSPMGEVLLKRRLANELGCTLEELDEQGVTVMSAGLAAISGSHPSPEAVDVMNQQGLDLSQHASQPLTPRLAQSADIILTMTRSHRAAIVREWPDAAQRTFTLAKGNTDISDPIGGPTALYQQCADQIDTHLSEWVKTFDLPKKSS